MLNEAALQALQLQMVHLRSMLVASLAALFILSAILTAFLGVQDYLIRKDLTAARKLVQEYEITRKPVINALIGKLQAFAQSHPDFQPILQKYGIPLSAPVQSPQPPSSTTPIR